jgi:hypothetical protein
MFRTAPHLENRTASVITAPLQVSKLACREDGGLPFSTPPPPLLSRQIRVLQPGGELILVNHIGAESGPRRIFELAYSRRWRGGSAGGRNFHGRGWSIGPPNMAASATERRPMPPMTTRWVGTIGS